MEALVVGVLGVMITLVTFLFGVYRIIKKDNEVRRDKVVDQLETCVRDNTATQESIKLLTQKVETVEASHFKLEDSVEKWMDKFDSKLDKIMDFLLDGRQDRRSD